MQPLGGEAVFQRSWPEYAGLELSYLQQRDRYVCAKQSKPVLSTAYSSVREPFRSVPPFPFRSPVPRERNGGTGEGAVPPPFPFPFSPTGGTLYLGKIDKN